MPAILKPENTHTGIEAFNTPILLIIFNRPDTTKRVFEAIRQQKPKHFFVAADGPRQGKGDDIYKCRAAREIIQVDWDCEFHTLYRDENRGCGYGPAEAITWFFENVEEGIILEDDCLPSPFFFTFCNRMLEFYRNDNRIFVISGTNPVIHWKSVRSSYLIGKLGGTWGWATWRRAWKNFDHDMAAWSTIEGKSKIRKYLNSNIYYSVFANEFNIFSDPIRKKDVWDHQWLFTRFFHESYSIIPTYNLISNIGFGDDAHHTTDINSKLSKMKTLLLHPKIEYKRFHINRIYDYFIFERFINPHKRSTVKRLILKLIHSLLTSAK